MAGKRYTPRQVAAISVGTALAVLLLALVIAVFAFFEYRKRKARCVLTLASPGLTAPLDNPRPVLSPINPADNMSRAKELNISHNLGPVHDIATWINLALSKGFSDLPNLFKHLRYDIKDYVAVYHSDTPVDRIMVADLSTGLNSDDLNRALSHPITKNEVICQYFAQQLLPSISPFCDPDLALLPLECVKLLRSMHTVPRALPNTFKQDQYRWMAMWRVVSNNLFAFDKIFRDDLNSESLELVSNEDNEQRESVTRRIAQSVQHVIQVDPTDDRTEDRMKGLRYLVDDAANLAVGIFTQINVYEVQWTPSDPSETRLVIYPALTCRSFEEYGALKDPKEVVGAEISGKKSEQTVTRIGNRIIKEHPDGTFETIVLPGLQYND